MVGTTGLEPAASCPPGMRSSQLSYVPTDVRVYEFREKLFNPHERTGVAKTIDAGFFERQLLQPT